MRVLWISWKDWLHPQAGGAEVVMHELAKRQAMDGHKVTVLTALYPGAATQEDIEGVRMIRLKGNRYLQPIIGLVYYARHLRNKFDLVVEAVNTAPYFSPFFRGKAKSVLVYHQLARKIWFYEAPLPVAVIGYTILEPIATFLMGKSKSTVIAMSESTKRDLIRFGFNPHKIRIISEGIECQPINDLADYKKFAEPTMLSHGVIRNMKRTLDQVKAFEIAKKQIPNLKMKISGSANGKYGKKVLEYVAASPYVKDIEYLGHTTEDQKMRLMQKCHIITVTSVKEGWGLIVTEANSQGTPAVVYDIDGLRDSVKHDETGTITASTPQDLADGIVRALSHTDLYERFSRAAWAYSKQLTFRQSYNDFKKVAGVK